MQNTSPLYKRLLSEEHTIETRLVLGTYGILSDEQGDRIVFGTGANATRILVEQGGAEDGFTEEVIFNIRTFNQLFATPVLTVGNAIAGHIEATMFKPFGTIDRHSQMIPYIRLVSADKTERSEWIKKGVFFIDTRETANNTDGLAVLNLYGIDALALTEADYPSDKKHSYPLLDKTIVQVIADKIEVQVDERTWANMTGGYKFGLPVGYSMREVLSYIGSIYLGNWCITDEGKLRLVTLTEIPAETRYLSDEIGYAITFGGDRILV